MTKKYRSVYIQDMNWEQEQWRPLIADRQLLNWLVKVPSDAEMLRKFNIDYSFSCQYISFPVFSYEYDCTKALT